MENPQTLKPSRSIIYYYQSSSSFRITSLPQTDTHSLTHSLPSHDGFLPVISTVQALYLFRLFARAIPSSWTAALLFLFVGPIHASALSLTQIITCSKRPSLAPFKRRSLSLSSIPLYYTSLLTSFLALTGS